MYTMPRPTNNHRFTAIIQRIQVSLSLPVLAGTSRILLLQNLTAHMPLLMATSTFELQRLLPNPNALVAVSKGMWAVKLCTNKIVQFLTRGAGKHRLTCIMSQL